ncbi:MAG TPA: hypothetical protein VN214_01965, partial [Pseudomonas sp.]|nr:hypothetical protein [Pseudomonas sp.]
GDPINRIDPKGSYFFAFLGKYVQRAAAGLPTNAIPGQARNASNVVKGIGSSAGASSSNIPRPARVALSEMNTLDSLDLASPSRLLTDSGQSTRDIATLGTLAYSKEVAINNFKVAQTQMSKLETLVKSQNLDPAGIPAHPVYMNYTEAQAALAQATADYTNGMELHFLKYPSQRKNAVENARWAIRRSSI